MDTSITARPAGFSIVDAAQHLGISRSGVYRLVEAGQIRMVKIGHRSIIPSSEIDRLIEEGAKRPGGNDATQ